MSRLGPLPIQRSTGGSCRMAKATALLDPEDQVLLKEYLNEDPETIQTAQIERWLSHSPMPVRRTTINRHRPSMKSELCPQCFPDDAST